MIEARRVGANMAILCLVILFALLCFRPIDTIFSHGVRRRLDYPSEYIDNDWTRYVYHIAGTTSPHTADHFIHLLNTESGVKEDGKHVMHDSSTMEKAIRNMKKSSGGWDPLQQTYKNEEFTQKMHRAGQGRRVGQHDNWKDYMHRRYTPGADRFDIVIRTGLAQNLNTTAWLEFLEAWRPVIENCYLIVMQQGDPQVDVPFPAWADFVLFNSIAVERMVDKLAWIFDMTQDTSSALSFGSVVADADYVYFLDRDTLPAKDASGKIINPLDEHLLNLKSPCNPYYFNSQYNPHRPGSDFSRGFPYSARKGQPCAISMGPLLHSSNYDAMTRLGKGDMFQEERRPDISQTVAYGQMFSLTTKNLAINREIAGPLVYFPPMSQFAYDIGENVEVLAGWVAKKALDFVQLGGVVVGGKGYVEYHPSSQPIDELPKDLLFAKHTDEVIKYISNAPSFSMTLRDQPTKLMRVMADWVHNLNYVHEGYAKYTQSIHDYMYVWDLSHRYNPEMIPRASKAKYMPSDPSTHKCAVMTITSEEPVMLPLFLRYYNRHFGPDMYILEHIVNDTLARPTATERQVQGSDVPAHYIRLEGAEYGFPVEYLAEAARMWQVRLFVKGYKCVLFLDVDEMVVANPEKYPGGLKEYLDKFVQSDANYYRVVGRTLAHVTQGDVGTREPPIDWSKSIMAQRKYWYRNQRYDKCALSKVPTNWKPGFHNNNPPPIIWHDVDLEMVHLPEADRDYCMEREKHKYELIKETPRTVYSAHIWEYPDKLKAGNLCVFANSDAEKSKDGAVTVHSSKGGFAMERIPDKFANVDL